MLSARALTFQFPEGQRACRQQQVTPSGTRMTMINRLTQLHGIGKD